MSGYLAGLFTVLAINIVFAYGIYLPVTSGQLNLGGAGFQATGAYSAAYAANAWGIGPALTIPLGMVVAGAVGVAMAFPILRTRGVYLVLATFAFAEMVTGAVLNSDALGGATGLSVPNFIDWYVPGLVALAVTALMAYLVTTRFDLTLRAAHDDEVVADLMGVDVRATKVVAFGAGAALAGLSGALYAHAFNYVDIGSFGALASIYVLLYVLLGGTQTPWGPIVGAAFFTLLPEVFRSALPALKSAVLTVLGHAGAVAPPDESWRFVALGALTVAMMASRPEGLVTRRMVDALTRRARRLGAGAAS